MSTITHASGVDMRIGDEFTISVPVRDTRRWPRFAAWIRRRPPPVVNQLRRFKITEVVSSTCVKGDL